MLRMNVNLINNHINTINRERHYLNDFNNLNILEFRILLNNNIDNKYFNKFASYYSFFYNCKNNDKLVYEILKKLFKEKNIHQILYKKYGFNNFILFEYLNTLSNNILFLNYFIFVDCCHLRHNYCLQ